MWWQVVKKEGVDGNSLRSHNCTKYSMHHYISSLIQTSSQKQQEWRSLLCELGFEARKGNDSRLGDDTLDCLSLQPPLIDWSVGSHSGNIGDNALHSLSLEPPSIDWGVNWAAGVGGSERVHCIWISRFGLMIRSLSGVWEIGWWGGEITKTTAYIC